jgi:hypothetical protein
MGGRLCLQGLLDWEPPRQTPGIKADEKRSLQSAGIGIERIEQIQQMQGSRVVPFRESC